MAASTALSVAAFSVVLTETFVAVAASTLVPATFLTFLSAIKADPGADTSANPFDPDRPQDADPQTSLVAAMPGMKELVKAIKAGVAQVDEIDLLVPKTAKIRAEFEFEASEQYAGSFAIGGMVNVIAVAAGYSALFQTATRNKVTLDVDFAVVNYRLA